MIDKNLDYEGAVDAINKLSKLNPSMSEDDRQLLLVQWHILNELEKYKSAYEQGDQFSLMTAIRECADNKLPLPDWAAKAFIEAYDTVNNAMSKSNSWDEVFGLPYSKHTRLPALQKKIKNIYSVWLDIKKAKAINPSTPIDAALFESVGKKYNIGKTLASDYYYEAVKIIGY